MRKTKQVDRCHQHHQEYRCSGRVCHFPINGFNQTYDDVTIGNSFDGAQGILGSVTVLSPIPTILTVDDSADAERVDRTVTVTHNSVTGLAAPIDFTGDGLTALNVLTGTKGFVTVNVLGTFAGDQKDGSNGCTTSIIGNDQGVVNVGDDGKLHDIQGSLTISNNLTNGNNYWNLDIDDSADKLPRIVTVTDHSVDGLAPASIQYDVERTALPITINGGSGGNAFTID